METRLPDSSSFPVADPDLELGGGGGGVLIFLPCWPFTLQSFLLFVAKIRGAWAPPLDLPLISPMYNCWLRKVLNREWCVLAVSAAKRENTMQLLSPLL